MSEFFLFFIGLFPFFYRAFSFFYRIHFDAKKAKISFPFYRSFSPSSLVSFHVSTFTFLLIINNLCERRNYSDFYYHAQLWNNVSNYIRHFKHLCSKVEKIWVRTRTLVVRRLERRPLTCEIITTALWLLVTWPTAWDAPFPYEFYFEKPCCCWWNRFPTVKKQFFFLNADST